MTKRHASGELELGHERAQLSAHDLDLVLGHPSRCQQIPAHLRFDNTNSRIFEFGLLGDWAIARGGECIHASQWLAGIGAPGDEFFPPVHSHEGLGEGHFGAAQGFDHDGATLAGHVQQVACFPAIFVHVLRVEFDHGLGHVPKESAHEPCATHAMPLVAKSPCIECKRVARLSEFSGGFVGDVGKVCFAVMGGEVAVFIKSFLARLSPLWERPLSGSGF